MEHHSLDPYPIPKDKKPLYINEPWLIDKSLLEYPHHREPDEKADNPNTEISTQADEQAGETDTQRSLVFTPTPSSTKLNEGEEITITLELSDIKMGEDGINTFGGKIEYDENVFEKITSDDITSQNNWSIAYNDEETAKKGTFLATINTGTSKNQIIGIIKLKVKTKLKTQDTEIKFTDLSSVAEDTVKLNDQTLKFSITGTVVPDEDKKDDTKNDDKKDDGKNNVVDDDPIIIGNKVNDIQVVENTITADNTQSNTKLPQTGEINVLIAVLALALVAVVSYIQIKRNVN